VTTTLIQALLSGIASGALYGLIALGLSLQFGVMKIINFAHGSFLMISMFVSLWLSNLLGRSVRGGVRDTTLADRPHLSEGDGA
jgi:branched-chain amino acid transport system permease protein